MYFSLQERESVLEELEKESAELDQTSEGPPTTTRRAKSVPANMLGNRNHLAEVGSCYHIFLFRF